MSTKPPTLTRCAGGTRIAPGPSDAEYTLPDAESQAREALVLALRLAEGADLGLLGGRWGIDLRPSIEGALEEPIEAGLVAVEGARIRLTDRGVLLANEVFARLAPGGAHRAGGPS